MCKNISGPRSAAVGNTANLSTADSPKAQKARKTHRIQRPKQRSSQTTKKRSGSDISYQNKDITSKVLAEQFKGKSFRVYGLDIPEIRQVLPTNLPTIKANELRMDNLFELTDGTVALVDYESDYKDENKVKYLNYLTGVVNRYLREKTGCPPLRMIVIYTGDIEREEVSDRYDLGSLKLRVESAFLSEFDGDEAYKRLKEKVEAGELLSGEEQMEFIILALSYKDKEKKQEKIRELAELAARIQDKNQQVFILAGLLVFTDKVIDQETAERIRRIINMTKVDMIYYEEKQQALREQAEAFEKKTKLLKKQTKEQVRQAKKQVKQAKEQERQAKEQERQAKEQVRYAKENNQKDIALKMIKDNQLPFDKISEYSGLDMEDVNRLAASIF